MSYKLQKPYTEKQIADFVVEHNHRKGLKIEETATALFALEPDEIMQDGEPVKNADYESEQLEKAKVAKIQDINEEKEKAFKGGIVFNGSHFDCDDRAQDRTGNRLLLLNAMPVETLEWLDFDYKPVVFTAVEFQLLCAAIFERVQFIEFKTGLFLEAVGVAQSLEEIEALVIDFTPSAEAIPQDVDSPVANTGDDITQEIESVEDNI